MFWLEENLILMTNMLKKVFNWSEVHLSEMTCYKIHTSQIFQIWFFRPFTVWIYCSSDLKEEKKNQPKIKEKKNWSLEHFFSHRRSEAFWRQNTNDGDLKVFSKMFTIKQIYRPLLLKSCTFSKSVNEFPILDNIFNLNG